MIVSFRHKGLKRFYETAERSKLSSELVERIAVLLADLDVAKSIEDLNRPSFRLHALKGQLNGLHALTVRANWRIVFRFVDGEVSDVDLVDYH
jgi:toxin HigB-1